MRRPIVVLAAVLVMAGLLAAPAMAVNPRGLDLPENFSYIGAPVKSMTMPSGHVVNYVDQGSPKWPVAVLIGGAGTSVRAFELTEFTRDLRQKLGVRVICVERNGFGMTKFEPADASGNLIAADAGDDALALADPVKTREMYAADVLRVLDQLKVDKFSIIAISGGGPYSGELAKQAGARVRSVHLAVAVYQAAPSGLVYPNPGYLAAMRGYIINPMVWWDMTGTTADKIPGWQEAAYEEAAWAAFVRGQDADPHAVALDYTIFKQTPADVSMVNAPLYTYYGGKDPLVPYAQRDAWVAAYRAAMKIKQRNYPDGVHDVQYRHYDQILLDVAEGGDYLVIAYRGRTRVIAERDWPRFRVHGAILGMQAWVHAQAPEK